MKLVKRLFNIIIFCCVESTSKFGREELLHETELLERLSREVSLPTVVIAINNCI